MNNSNSRSLLRTHTKFSADDKPRFPHADVARKTSSFALCVPLLALRLLWFCASIALFLCVALLCFASLHSSFALCLLFVCFLCSLPLLFVCLCLLFVCLRFALHLWLPATHARTQTASNRQQDLPLTYPLTYP